MEGLCCTEKIQKEWNAVKNIKKRIEDWLETFIIGLNLCPFAKQPWQAGRVKIVVVESDKENDLTKTLLKEILNLVEINKDTLETSLIVHPDLLQDFDDFVAYCEWTEELIVKSGVEGLVQIVGFHPDYYFEGSEKDDKANFTNRSPYPILHLIRGESVEEAIEYYPDIEEIPKRNIELLRKMDLEELIKLCRNDAK